MTVFIHMRFFSWFQRHNLLFFPLNHCVCSLFVSHSVRVFLCAATAAIIPLWIVLFAVWLDMKSNLWTMKLWKLIESVALQPPNHSNNCIEWFLFGHRQIYSQFVESLKSKLSFFGVPDGVVHDVVCNHLSLGAKCLCISYSYLAWSKVIH